MLDTSSRANFKPTAEIDDLDALAKEVCRHLTASANAAQNFLEHALAAGDALIRAKEQIKHGDWLKWLKSCDLSADTAERYMKLARHRAELNYAGVRNLSLSVALRLIAKPQSANSKPKKKTKPATSFDALAWWTNASQKERSHFLEGVGLKPLLAAIPPAWQQDAEREIGPVSSRATTLLKLALSTDNEGEAVAALADVKRVLAAGRYDHHDLELHLNNHRRFGRAA
ncbi:MAG TPA: DUF3102 domain-containing protein [Xanthobacteraceae bacterium]|jgi:hypothetical protein